MAVESYADSQTRGGKYFKPKDHGDAVAIIVEYKGYNPERPGYKGEKQPQINADFTVFKTAEDLENGNADEYPNQWLSQKAIVGWLKNQSTGDVFIRKLTQLPGQNGNSPAWAFNGVDTEETYQKALKFYDDREKAVEEAVSGDNVPPWLK